MSSPFIPALHLKRQLGKHQNVWSERLCQQIRDAPLEQDMFERRKFHFDQRSPPQRVHSVVKPLKADY